MTRFATPLLLLTAFSSIAVAADKPTKQQAPAELSSAAEMSQDKANKEIMDLPQGRSRFQILPTAS